MTSTHKRILAALAVLGICLRVAFIWAMPTWYDENFTLVVARLPLPRLLAATAGDVHPPLWYLLVALFDIPGQPNWVTLRLPALLASLVSMLVFWTILQVSYNSHRVRLVAFGLFAILPTQIYYAQEGRMYALLTLLVLLAWLAMIMRYYNLLFVSVALLLWTHNYGLFYAAALWIASLIDEHNAHNRTRRGYWQLTLTFGLAALTFVPWVLVIVSQMRSIEGGYWMLTASLQSMLGDLLHSTFAGGLPGSDLYNFAIFYLLIGWLALRAVRSRTVNLPLVTLAYLPFLLAAAVTLLWQPILLYRALVPCSAFIVLLAAEQVEHLFEKRTRLWLAALLVLPALLVNTASVVMRSAWPTTLHETTGMMQLIDANWQPGDLLIHADDGIWITGSAYWHNVDNTLRVPPCGQVRGGLTETTRQAIGIPTGALPAEYPGRIWVVTSQTPMNPDCETSALQTAGLLNTAPLACIDNKLVRSCVYLLEK